MDSGFRQRDSVTSKTGSVTGSVTEYLCPTHSTRLMYVLKGGAGFCSQCRLYVQAGGVPMPALDRPTAERKRKRRR